MSEQQDNHQEILQAIQEINHKLDPIYEAYMAWQTIGRWGKYFLYATGAVLGIVVALKEIFRK